MHIGKEREGEADSKCASPTRLTPRSNKNIVFCNGEKKKKKSKKKQNARDTIDKR